MPEGLTTRESECVRLAGQGLEDKEIAARLRISPRTVGNHLHRAYAKLGVSDRKLAARRLSIGYSEASILIPDTGPNTLNDPTSAEQADDAVSDPTTSWLLPAPPRGALARVGIIVAGAAIALVFAIGIVTAGMVVPSLFDRLAPAEMR
ncbi:DNA-binding CsgD family transcriptional regulator [Brevundimonas vesicularis]|uniref:helix-turn-helix domain-containing protein n=1 Tax=Brevundimonas vesicularis TaxID=41276 RepID=UPI00277E364D|nr:helix-turn-helix transcriptional regulator [Brevundimonas vesicularis]MDQ1191532.1 DNA-binding CsgD family transcriptional regulator [Brevundimonas vesicularis]